MSASSNLFRALWNVLALVIGLAVSASESLARKIQARNEYDKTIMETEAAYTKVGAFICVVCEGFRQGSWLSFLFFG